jgi:shikimate dehydrogenase
VLHRAAYAHLGLPWRYEAIEVAEDDLAAFLAGLDATWRGLSLTMPLKERAALLADDRSPLVDATGAANTLLLEPGRLSAHNTDVAGIVAALSEAGARRGSAATVLGGGSTAASAVAALSRLAGDVVVCVRTPTRAERLLAVASAVGVRLSVEPWERAGEHLRAPIVVATTPPGAADALADEVPRAPGALLDVVYDPWPTRLAQAWAEAGGVVRSGLDLLVHQAVGQVQLMTGRPVPVGVLRAALDRGTR